MTIKSFSSEINSNYDYLRNFARKLTGNEDDAKDLVQNTSIKAFTNRDRLDDPGNFKPWVSTILYNQFITDYKKRRRRQELLEKNGQSEAYFYNASSTSNAGYDQLKKQDLLEIAQSVGKKSYHAFKLYHYGYTYKEIAGILDIAIGTVKSRINFLRSKVKGAHENLSFCDN